MSPPAGRVLLVGGKHTGLRTLAAALEGRGLAVAVVHTDRPLEVEDAAAAADAMVLADDGLGDECVEVLRRIRARSANLPIILIGRSCRVDVAVRAIRLGMVEYFSRPFDPRRLGDRIEDAMERRACLAELSRRRSASTAG